MANVKRIYVEKKKDFAVKATELKATWRDRTPYDVVYVTEDGEVCRETAYEGIPYPVTQTVPEKEDGIFVAW